MNLMVEKGAVQRPKRVIPVENMNVWIAASDNRIDLVEKYLQSGMQQPTRRGWLPPAHAAASYGHRDLLLELINVYNGDINVEDEDGDTPHITLKITET